MENLKFHSKVSYSENDLRLKRYLELDREIKTLTKEFDQIKEEIKHAGSYSTQHFVAVVEDRSRTVPPSLAVLVKEFGERVRGLCTETTFKVVKVSEKGG